MSAVDRHRHGGTVAGPVNLLAGHKCRSEGVLSSVLIDFITLLQGIDFLSTICRRNSAATAARGIIKLTCPTRAANEFHYLIGH